MANKNSATKNSKGASVPAARSTKKIEYANFTCRFDSDETKLADTEKDKNKPVVRKELLDYANEIVIPAFFNDSLIREVRGGNYYLLNVSLVELDRSSDPVVGIVGRFVKNNNIKVEQRVEIQSEERVLVPDGREVERALSSVFLLILNDHTLVYLHETQDAPGIEAFGNTMQFFFNKQRKTMLDILYKENVKARKEKTSSLTNGDIRDQHPLAKVKITPLTSEKGIENALDDFVRIQEVAFISHRSNASTMGGAKDFALAYREAQKELASTTATSAFYNADGMERDQVQELVTEVAGDADAGIRIVGQGADGERITRTRDEIKYKEDYPNDTATIDNLVPTGGHFWDHLKRALQKGLFLKRTSPENPEAIKERIDQILQRHGDEIRRV